MRGLIGNTASEPRVFGHDAVKIVVGAINYTSQMDNPGFNSGLTVTNFGSGYTVGDVITLSAGVGVSAAKVKVLKVNAGVITSYELTDSGTANKPYGEGYTVNDALTQASVTPVSGTGFAATVNNIDIPNTEERGCVILHVSNSSAEVGLIMESGNPITVRVKAEDVVGHQCPLLVKRVTAGSDLVAIY